MTCSYRVAVKLRCDIACVFDNAGVFKSHFGTDEDTLLLALLDRPAVAVNSLESDMTTV